MATPTARINNNENAYQLLMGIETFDALFKAL